MKTMFILILALGFVGCGSESFVDPAFNGYLSRFKSEGASYGIEVKTDHLSIELVDSIDQTNEGLVSGQCNNGTVSIVRAYWNATSEAGRETILYHELGHCALGRDHISGETWNHQLNIPISLMIKDVSIVLSYWNQNRDYYIKELFTGQ